MNQTNKTKAVRGPFVLLVMAVSLLLLAGTAYVAMTGLAKDRFAVSLSNKPAGGRKLRTDLPIWVRIVKSRAGRSKNPAMAFLIAGDGSRVSGDVLPLVLGKDERGKLIEEAEFPKLETLPKGGMVSAVVMRLPKEAHESKAWTEVLLVVDRPHGSLPSLFAEIRAICERRGGQAEFVSAEVRLPLETAGSSLF